MKVITWNVNNRVGTLSQQVQELGQREPDVVALQDVNCNAASQYIEAFRRIGLPHVLHTLDRQPQAIPTGVLLASRFPLSLLPDRPESVLWSQGCYTPDREKLQRHWGRRTLFARLCGPSGEIKLANVYITPANHYEPGANGGRQLYPYLKLDLLSGVYQTLAAPTDRPRLLCGDFNTPQHQRESGEIISAPMRLHRPYLKECHCRRVAKAAPYLSPKGGGGPEHGVRKAGRERHLYRAGQLGRIG